MKPDLDKLFSEELAAAERSAAADDELMAAAARGEPFWGAGKAPVSPEQIVGLGDFVPTIDPTERFAAGVVSRANGCNAVFPIDGEPEARPARDIAIAGRFRVYFNRHQAAPLVWCVALLGVDKPWGIEDGGPPPLFEVAVAEVVIAAQVRTVYAPKATPDDEDGRPSAWLEVDGVLQLDPASSTARIG